MFREESMTQQERREYLIRELLKERGEEGALPAQEEAQKGLLRALFNVRPPREASAAFLEVQDAYLREEIRRRGVTEAAALSPVKGRLCLWQGDITTLACDAIVNAANSAMLGCFHPNHGCIDNAIHTFSGVQLRLFCARMMRGGALGTGEAVMTPAFNLPSRFIAHTVGPIVRGALRPEDRELLARCYESCLSLAAENGVETLAFCCISTGEFGFPPQEGAKVAVETVTRALSSFPSITKVIFNVFRTQDLEIYRRVLA